MLVGILRQSQVARVVADDVLDKLNIKQSVVDPRPIYGDICLRCGEELEKDIVKAIAEATTILSKKIEVLARRTKSRPQHDQHQANREAFSQLAKDLR